MAVEHIEIEARDGAKISAPLYRSDQSDTKKNNTKYLFLLLPAMGVKAAYYTPLARRLTASGFSVLLCDLRGQGTSNQKVPQSNFGYTDLLEVDLPAYIKAAKRHAPDKHLIFLGHSLGGHLSLLHAATRPGVVSAVAIIASGSVYWKAYKFPQNIKIWLGAQSSVLISHFIGYFPGHKIGFGGIQPKAVMRDWARQSRTGRFSPQGSHLDYESAMAEAELPVFALSIEGDKFAPHGATDHLLSKMKKAKITHIKYQPDKSLKKKINHFRWVKHSADIEAYLENWVKTV